jgi:hypothetical protein
LSQNQNFHQQFTAGTQTANDQAYEQPQHLEHEWFVSENMPRKLSPNRILASHTNRWMTAKTMSMISGVSVDMSSEQIATIDPEPASAPIPLQGIRKIVHVDMDAFYASVEQRDNPEIRGKPVVVAWKGNRSVVCAASYEARRFGVHSAMPAVRAERLCPEAIFVPPDFMRYRAVSHAVREIFQRHTDLIEPLSLDEAYLDVTENKTGLATATRVAKAIRHDIREELQLTASAGAAPNKFLAKIASDWRKPNCLPQTAERLFEWHTVKREKACTSLL